MIRPELNGKLIILGFLGICPDVDIRFARLDRPAPLTFLLSGNADEGRFNLSVEIIDAKDRKVVASTAGSPLAVEGSAGRISIAPTVLLTFGHAGAFLVRCLVDGETCFEGAFRVSREDAQAI